MSCLLRQRKRSTRKLECKHVLSYADARGERARTMLNSFYRIIDTFKVTFDVKLLILHLRKSQKILNVLKSPKSLENIISHGQALKAISVSFKEAFQFNI